MKCVICGKDVMKHSKQDVSSCLRELNIPVKYENGITVASRLRIPVTVNFRHGWFKLDGKEYHSDDVDLDIMRLCLAKAHVPESVELPSEESKEEEIIEEHSDDE